MFYICKRNSFGNAEEKCDAVHVFFFVFYIFVRDSGIFQGLIFPQTE